MKKQKITLFPKVHGVGGMVSFSHKFIAALEQRNIAHSFTLDEDTDAILVIGGTRNLGELQHAKKAGIPIVQRLNGINWIHRKKNTGLKHYLRAEYGNMILKTIRNHYATNIIYQSQFVVQWWEKKFGTTKVPYTVIHNGVDLSAYAPTEQVSLPTDFYRLLLVEGNLGGGYESGLITAIKNCELLTSKHQLPTQLTVVGQVAPEFAKKWENSTNIPIEWKGKVPREAIPAIDQSAHALFSADLNAACPNAVIEALACGLPVVAYDTGALPELVNQNAGYIAPYGGNPWNLDDPDIEALAQGTAQVFQNNPSYRINARKLAEEKFSLDQMTDQYLEVLLG